MRFWIWDLGFEASSEVCCNCLRPFPLNTVLRIIAGSSRDATHPKSI
jgi:hypothetical protein